MTNLSARVPKPEFFNRPSERPLDKLFNICMPEDPRPVFIWPRLAILYGRASLSSLRVGLMAFFTAFVMMFTAATLAILTPLDDISILKGFTWLYRNALPPTVAVGFAVASCVAVTIALIYSCSSGLVGWQSLAWSQRASKDSIYDTLLRLALFEEMLFRAGSEKWSRRQKLHSAVTFGLCHLANVWIPVSGALAIMMGALLLQYVYHLEYKKSNHQITATSVAARVHATCNYMLLVMMLAYVVMYVISLVVSQG